MANKFEDPLRSIDPVMDNKKKVEIRKEVVKTPVKSERGSVEDVNLSEVEFPKLKTKVQGEKFSEEIFNSIPVNVAVELGKTKITLKELYELREGSIIELDKLVGEPLELVVNGGQTIAQGEVVAIDNYFGIRLTNISAAK